jgi:hypothetical protein
MMMVFNEHQGKCRAVQDKLRATRKIFADSRKSV